MRIMAQSGPASADVAGVSPSEPRTARYFLSYASEDKKVADDIAARLRAKGVEVHVWENLRGGDVLRNIADPISTCDGFLALLSTNYLASYWCGKEFNLAVHREELLKRQQPAASFIAVLKVGDIPAGEGGFARAFDSLDCTTATKKTSSIKALLKNLPTNPRGPLDRLPPSAADPTLPTFRNRDQELDRLRQGLSTLGGQRFWLVVSSSQLGKTWFLNQMASTLPPVNETPWHTRLVNVREFAEPNRQDTGLILEALFGIPAQVAITDDAVTEITKRLLEAQRPHLCLLDSAELLDVPTARRLREIVGAVDEMLEQSAAPGVRLGVVIASRRGGDEWRGLVPPPRLTAEELTEFRTDVINGALRELAASMKRTFSASDFERDARRVHRFTEGLPALLVRTLGWISDNQWLHLGRLDTDAVLDEIAGPYIKNTLLSRDSLFPRIDAQDPHKHAALTSAFAVLAPYRIFTQSHLDDHAAGDPGVREALACAHWSTKDLWRALERTALLSQTVDEPWLEIQGAIRKLLFRHFYPASNERLEAHRRAREYMRTWPEEQKGVDRIQAAIETIWHEAARLGIERPTGAEDSLLSTARDVVAEFVATRAYSLERLKETTARRLSNDVEIGGALSFAPGLFSRLVEDVRKP
jgi:hypothetical protein